VSAFVSAVVCAGVVAFGTATQNTGIVLGRVIDADTSVPVPHATVTLLGATSPDRTREEVIADADGRFVFHSLARGYYRLQAHKAGLIFAEYGQRWPEGPFQQLYVAAGQPVTEATVRMWKPGAIGGVVVDDAGEPAVGVHVRALRVVTSGGRRQLRPASRGSDGLTDDRGVYRIGNLPPGRYYLMAPTTIESAPTSTSTAGLRVGDHVISSAGLRSAAPTVMPDGRLEMTRTIYHPSSNTVEDATAIAIGSGEQRGGVDIRLTRDAAHRVSGVVLGAGGPAALTTVRLVADEVAAFRFASGLEAASATTGPDGRFTMLGVPPGPYVLRVLQAQPDSPTLWAEQSVLIVDDDLDNVLLQLREGASVSGRIAFEGAATPNPAAMARIAVRLIPPDGREDTAFMRPPPVEADGTFRTLAHPPGRYFLDVAGSLPPAMRLIRSVEIGGRDLRDRPIGLGAEDISGVVITIAEELGGIAGTVALPPDDAAALVAVFPADVRTWIQDGMAPSRTAIVLTDADARFAIRDLRPGAYLAVALRATSPPDLQDPEIIDRLSRIATEVQVPDTGIVSVRLVLGAGR
jgi:hypothetical protein